MPMYDRHTFEPEDHIPPHLKKDARDTVMVAVAMGWKLHVNTNNSCTIIAPNDRKKHHFAGNSRATIPLNRIRRDIFRYADPALLAIADQVIDGKLPPEVAAMVEKVAYPRNEEQPEEEPVPTPNDMPQHRPEPSESEDKAEPYVVSEQPMLAKAGTNRGYESAATVERHWSDGTTDYKCVDCDYSSKDRLSVRSHRNKHGKKQGPSTHRGQTFVADVPNAAHYRPRQTRIDALAEVIEGLMADGGKDPGEIAKTALTWVHEQSRQGTSLAAEREELGPEDTLNRIRSLLDDGTFARQRSRIEALEERLTQTEQALEETAQRADKAQSTLRALSELASESVLGEAQQRAEGA